MLVLRSRRNLLCPCRSAAFVYRCSHHSTNRNHGGSACQHPFYQQYKPTRRILFHVAALLSCCCSAYSSYFLPMLERFTISSILYRVLEHMCDSLLEICLNTHLFCSVSATPKALKLWPHIELAR